MNQPTTRPTSVIHFLRGLALTLFTALILTGCGSEEAEQAFRDAVEINELNITSLSIEIDSGNTTFEAGTVETARAMAQVSSGGSDIDVTSRVTWTSSDGSVLGVNQSGSLSAQAGVDSVATVFVEWADLSASLPITVSTEDLDSIALSGPNDVSACSAGHQLSASGTYAVGDVRDVSHLVSWTSLSTSLARVSSSGVVDTLGSGAASVEASYNAITSPAYAINVRDNVDAITVAPNTNVSVTVGNSTQFSATASYNDASPDEVVSSTVNWVSGTPSVLEFSATEGEEGLANGLVVGTSLINATCAAQTPVSSADISVTVEAVKTITGIEIQFNGNTLIPNQEVSDSPIQLVALLRYSDSSTDDVTTNDDTDWTVDSSSGTAASINNTNDKGEVTFNAIGETTFEVAHEVNGTTYRDTIILTVE